MNKLSHVNENGHADMVDVSDKPNEIRTARAQGTISLAPQTIAAIRQNDLQKGDVLAIAQFAGICAAKRCFELIPLCHPLLLTKVDVVCALTENGAQCTSRVRCVGKTGVEMEALTAVSLALLTIYDMCKAIDKQMVIGNIELIDKTKSPIDVP